MARLFEADRIQMRKMRRAGHKLQTIADHFGCSVPHVSNILSGCVGIRDRIDMPEDTAPAPPAITVQQPGSIIRPIPFSALMGGHARRSHTPAADR